MSGSDLRLNYPPFNNSCSASYSELYIISHSVPRDPNNFPLYLNMLTSSLTLRFTLKEKPTFIDVSHKSDTAPAFDIGYLCKMINSSLKKVLFFSPFKLFHFMRLREVKEVKGCGHELRWLQSLDEFPSSEKALQYPEVGVGTWPSSGQSSHSLGFVQLELEEESNLSWMVKLKMKASSRFHCVDKAGLGEPMLTQRELQRKESIPGACCPWSQPTPSHLWCPKVSLLFPDEGIRLPIIFSFSSS